MPDFVDPASRIERLARKLEPELRKRFMEFVRRAENVNTLEQLADLLSRGRINEALAAVENAFSRYTIEVNEAFVQSGSAAARAVSKGLQIGVSFDRVNTRAVEAMRRNRLRLVTNFNSEQRKATQQALIDGITRGINPREIARNFRDSIGLTANQEKAVRNYKRMLENLNAEALTRKLRDRRFDSTVLRAISDDDPLTAEQINTMATRYRERMLKYRSEVIARTEALRSAHEGTEEMYRQAHEAGEFEDNEIIREWNTAKDERVRSSHAFMHGQTRVGFEEPFESGDGNKLRYPGDPNAPPEDTIQCRCAVGTRIRLLRIEPGSITVTGV